MGGGRAGKGPRSASAASVDLLGTAAHPWNHLCSTSVTCLPNFLTIHTARSLCRATSRCVAGQARLSTPAVALAWSDHPHLATLAWLPSPDHPHLATVSISFMAASSSPSCANIRAAGRQIVGEAIRWMDRFGAVGGGGGEMAGSEPSGQC